MTSLHPEERTMSDAYEKYFRPVEVYAGEFADGGFGPGSHWWRGPGKIQVHGQGHGETPIAFDVSAPGSDKSVQVEMTVEHARWFAALLTEAVEHAERYPQDQVRSER
jgi:hypothetical protein